MIELEQIAQKYRQVLLAISIKYGHESPHDTVLRYIKEWEIHVREDQKRKTVNKGNRFNWKSIYEK